MHPRSTISFLTYATASSGKSASVSHVIGPVPPVAEYICRHASHTIRVACGKPMPTGTRLLSSLLNPQLKNTSRSSHSCASLRIPSLTSAALYSSPYVDSAQRLHAPIFSFMTFFKEYSITHEQANLFFNLSAIANMITNSNA